MSSVMIGCQDFVGDPVKKLILSPELEKWSFFGQGDKPNVGLEKESDFP